MTITLRGFPATNVVAVAAVIGIVVPAHPRFGVPRSLDVTGDPIAVSGSSILVVKDLVGRNVLIRVDVVPLKVMRVDETNISVPVILSVEQVFWMEGDEVTLTRITTMVKIVVAGTVTTLKVVNVRLVTTKEGDARAPAIHFLVVCFDASTVVVNLVLADTRIHCEAVRGRSGATGTSHVRWPGTICP